MLLLFHKYTMIYYALLLAAIVLTLCYALLITMKARKAKNLETLTEKLSQEEKEFFVNLLHQYNYYNIESIDVIIQYCQTELYKKGDIKKYADAILTVLLTVIGTLTLEASGFSIEIRLTAYLLIILCIGVVCYTLINVFKSVYHQTFFSDEEVSEDLLLNLLNIKLSIIQKQKSKSKSKGIGRKLLKMIKKR